MSDRGCYLCHPSPSLPSFSVEVHIRGVLGLVPTPLSEFLQSFVCPKHHLGTLVSLASSVFVRNRH